MKDTTCLATVKCQYNCYDTGGGGDTCAAACSGLTNALFVGYSACNAGTCNTQCLCP